jgi:hypothetical protein
MQQLAGWMHPLGFFSIDKRNWFTAATRVVMTPAWPTSSRSAPLRGLAPGARRMWSVSSWTTWQVNGWTSFLPLIGPGPALQHGLPMVDPEPLARDYGRFNSAHAPLVERP